MAPHRCINCELITKEILVLVPFIVTMSKLNLNEQMSKLSLDSEKEDNLTFYLTSLRRRGKCSYLFSKTALFIPDLEGSCWN